MTFRLPDGSSTPPRFSTPVRPQSGQNSFSFSNMTDNPSTTPAGPPPSSAKSFTPAGLPQSSSRLFSTTPITTTANLFGFGKATTEPSNPTHSSTRGFSNFVDLGSSPPIAQGFGDISGDFRPEFMKSGTSDIWKSSVHQPSSNQPSPKQQPPPNRKTTTFQNLGPLATDRAPQASLPFTNVPVNFGSSIPSASVALRSQLSIQKPRVPSSIPPIARSLASRLGPAKLLESDAMILITEASLSHVPQITSGVELEPLPLSPVVEKLITCWSEACDAVVEVEGDTDEDLMCIGPDESAAPIAKAFFLSSLLLRLHHPPSMKASNAFSNSRNRGSTGFSHSFNAHAAGRPLPIPKVLLDWLDVHHNPYRGALSELQTHQPNPAHHANFWDLIIDSLLRGKLDAIIRILEDADFSNVRSNSDDVPMTSAFDRLKTGRYNDLEAGNIRRVLQRAIQVLRQCPAMASGDWDVRGSEWNLFRRKVNKASEDLMIFAEGTERESLQARTDGDSPFTAEHFGISNNLNPFSMTEATRKAESKIPWSIYQHLKAMYGIMLGSTTDIMSFSGDWTIATVCLTAWSDGEVAPKAASLRRSRMGEGLFNFNASSRASQSSSESGYIARLADSFALATDQTSDEGFQVNTANLGEVGLASIFENDVQGVIAILRCWSLPIVSAVVEIAHHGRWYSESGTDPTISGLDDNDLMVLNYDQPSAVDVQPSRESVLTEYAEALSTREQLRSDDDPAIQREGWELAIQVLGRLSNAELVSRKTSTLVDQLPLNTSERVDKLLALCYSIDQDRQAHRIAEKYADSLILKDTTNPAYGHSLHYYALAHHAPKLCSTIHLLTSFSLIHSLAYPPASDLDPHLANLLRHPKATLTSLNEQDPSAAELLHTHLSGYATVRRFYDLRDRIEPTKSNSSSSAANMTDGVRRREACKALIAIITSSASSISGGLYDDDSEAVISVDGLLTLLGESLVFLDRPEPLLTTAQTFALLRAVEDLQTVHPRVYAQCEDFLHSTVAAYTALSSDRGSKNGDDLRTTLRRAIQEVPTQSQLPSPSMSPMKMTAGFSRSLMSMGGSVSGNSTAALGGNGVLPRRSTERQRGASGSTSKRGWDWRTGAVKMAPAGGQVSGEMVIQVLRLGLAKEIGRGWTNGC